MRVPTTACVIALVALLSVSTADAQMRGMGRLTGVVVDDGGAPIDGVKLRTTTAGGDAVECETDAKGKWTLAGIGRGEWMVLVAKPGFAPKRLKVTVEREIERSQEIKVSLAKS